MSQVRLVNLRKVFGEETVAVHNLDLDIVENEFITLLGPSGCGKTTTLRMVAGLESPTEGAIYFGDELVNNVPPAKRNIAMVFQSYALYPHMTVRGNLEYPLKKRKVPAAERRDLVANSANLLQITELLDRKPRQLSGGQQQRVALGRAIIRNPEVYLLDEPLSNLDAKLRSYMRAELIQLHRRVGKTMIYVTHDQLEAMTMSDRIAILNEGKLQQLATPDDVYNKPVNRFVASFIGSPSMNFLEGEVTSEGSTFLFKSPHATIELPSEKFAGTNSGRRVTAGIRPEDIILGSGTHTGEITVVEPTGYETLVFLTMGEMTLIARVGAEVHVEALQKIDLSFKGSHVHLFDADTGERLGTDA
ncbi:MAG TPA: ABC transporter ATP-binding protein [Rhodospirillales bacterium]|nr:ABC transporter ATP-binding protein [Rhodospirillales bacterium]